MITRDEFSQHLKGDFPDYSNRKCMSTRKGNLYFDNKSYLGKFKNVLNTIDNLQCSILKRKKFCKLDFD